MRHSLDLAYFSIGEEGRLLNSGGSNFDIPRVEDEDN